MAEQSTQDDPISKLAELLDKKKLFGISPRLLIEELDIRTAIVQQQLGVTRGEARARTLINMEEYLTKEEDMVGWSPTMSAYREHIQMEMGLLNGLDFVEAAIQAARTEAIRLHRLQQVTGRNNNMETVRYSLVTRAELLQASLATPQNP